MPSSKNSVVYANELPLRNIACVTRLSRHKLRNLAEIKIYRWLSSKLHHWTFFWPTFSISRSLFLFDQWKTIIWKQFCTFVYNVIFRQKLERNILNIFETRCEIHYKKIIYIYIYIYIYICTYFKNFFIFVASSVQLGFICKLNQLALVAFIFTKLLRPCFLREFTLEKCHRWIQFLRLFKIVLRRVH